MDHNQNVVDQYLKTFLATESRITTPDLYEAIKGQLNPTLELAEFRPWLAEQFNAVLAAYESTRGRNGGIKLTSGEARVIKPKVEKASGTDSSDVSDVPVDIEETEEDTLTIHLNPSLRIYKTDLRNWAVQKRAGDIGWVSQYYNTSLDGILGCYVRRAMNEEFRATPEKIKDLKELIQVIKTCEASLIESFSKIVVEKSAIVD